MFHFWIDIFQLLAQSCPYWGNSTSSFPEAALDLRQMLKKEDKIEIQNHISVISLLSLILGRNWVGSNLTYEFSRSGGELVASLSGSLQLKTACFLEPFIVTLCCCSFDDPLVLCFCCSFVGLYSSKFNDCPPFPAEETEVQEVLVTCLKSTKLSCVRARSWTQFFMTLLPLFLHYTTAFLAAYPMPLPPPGAHIHTHTQ